MFSLLVPYSTAHRSVRNVLGWLAAAAPGFIATQPDYERQSNNWPAAFDTIAMRRMGALQEIANAVTFLASDNASWNTGRTISVTGGPLA
jgi:3-oxoacyl-[acyl-carrier protein] reductase